MKTLFIDRRIAKSFAMLFMLILLSELVFPTAAYALTGGPSQPEVQSFEPIGTSQMVDISSGDFNYNIPLIDVGGYPLNMSYHAGIGMDQEASTVGLGWNINPGVINRSLRGLPDDFNGVEIKNETNIRPNRTIGFSGGVGTEIFGFGKIGANTGVFLNNYKGVGFTYGMNIGVGFGLSENTSMTAGLAFSGNTQSGVDLSANAGLSLSDRGSKSEKAASNGLGLTIASQYNSRAGLQALNYGIGYDHKSASKAQGLTGNSRSISAGGTHSFALRTYIPNISNNFKSRNISLNASVGGMVWGVNPHARFTGYFNSQKLAKSKVKKKAYGYFYEQNKLNNDVLLDFNREQDVNYTEYTENLPIANHTFDIFSASGQGIGGSYRLFRSDVPVLHSDNQKSGSAGGSLGAEFGAGLFHKFGGNINANWSRSESKKWNYPLLNKNIDFVSDNGNPDYEPAYFKSSSEMAITDSRLYTNMGKEETVSLEPSRFWGLNNVFTSKNGDNKYVRIKTKNENTRNTRETRSDVLSVMTSEEARIAALDKYILDYNEDWVHPEINKPLKKNLISRAKTKGRFSELAINTKDGAKYVYGIPAYNNVQKDVVFNVAGRFKECSQGLVRYSKNVDNTLANSLGQDHYYNAKTTPAYAHSYLLTGYLSPDYVDITGNGISEDDLGSAVKFNYARIHKNYKWRVPFEYERANVSDALRSYDPDDKGSYSYGEKEYWLMHSVETKNNVAVFHYSDRRDGFGVTDENGGRGDDMGLKKLDKIVLYAKQEYLRHKEGATPIKTVHFNYDYSMCPSVKNNNGAPEFKNGVNINQARGKLTLKSVYFTYGRSSKGRLSAYKFAYSDVNPSYNFKGSDRWGAYKSNAGCQSASLSNPDFPFTPQDKSIADANASAWALTQIDLPSGGTITVAYESDDYAYVQDKQAMRMFRLAGFGKSHNIGSIDSRIYDGANKHNNIIYFELDETINLSAKAAAKKIKSEYLNGMDQLQYTINVDVDDHDNNEFIKGYVDIDWARGCGVIDGNTGWVAIKMVKLGDKHPAYRNRMVSPIARYSWNFARLNMPHLVYPFSEPSSTSGVEEIRALGGVFADIRYMIDGFYNSLEKKEFCKNVDTDKSWIRATVPNKVKFGGGHRVKAIRLSDNWDDIGAGSSSSMSFDYGQSYEYTTTEEQENGSTKIISSGVAAYEPIAGGDENPFRLPRQKEIENKLVPNDIMMSDEPIGESFYPGPSVIYSKVTVKPLAHEGVSRTAAGSVVHEFYTAKDFPTKVDFTEIYPIEEEPSPFWGIFKFTKEVKAITTQGYTIIQNDMHGKPKSQYTYAENATSPLSGVSYEYKTKEGDPGELSNVVSVINSTGEVSQKTIGVEMDYNVDSRSSISSSTSAGLSVNVETIPFIWGVLTLPVPLPSYSQQNINYKSAVVTKIIKKYAILEKTIAHKNGSTLESQHVLFNEETGAPMLTATQNEFRDHIYNFAYPAYWKYDGMGPSYRNIGITFKGVTVAPSNGEIILNGVPNDAFLTSGDECLLNNSKLVTVYDGEDNVLNLIDINGNPIASTIGSFSLKVVRSGRRNQLGASMASVQTKSNPINGNELVFNDVLNASAMEYSDDWKTHVNYLSQANSQATPLQLEWKTYINCLLSEALIAARGTTVATTNSDVYISKDVTPPQSVRSIPNLPDCHGDAKILDNETGLWSAIDLLSKPQTNNLPINNRWKDLNNKMTSLSEFSCASNFMTSTLRDKLIELTVQENVNPPYQTESDIRNMLENLPLSEFFFQITPRYTNEKDVLMELAIVTNHYHMGCSFDILIPSEYLDKRLKSIDLGLLEGAFLPPQGFPISGVFDMCGEDKSVALQARADCFGDMEINTDCYTLFNEDEVNPYRAGMRGNWRPLRSHAFLEKRQHSAVPNVREDGAYLAYQPFWDHTTGSDAYTKGNDSRWKWASEVTKYTPFGNEVENKDALERYSSALYGYNNAVPTAVASNAKYTQIAYDGFEDYDYLAPVADYICGIDHFSYRFEYDDATSFLDQTKKHSGRFSLKVNANKSVELSRDIQTPAGGTNLATASTDQARIVTLEDDLGVFQPEAGEYIVSAWIKEDQSPTTIAFSDAKIQVDITDAANATTTVDCHADGYIIEGWQRIEQKITVPAGAKNITVKLVSSGAVDSWFDDIRIFPYNGNMKTYAYDQRTLRLMAELDENNYATFYEYDLEGNLVRVKKETIRGVKTLQENRNHSSKSR